MGTMQPCIYSHISRIYYFPFVLVCFARTEEKSSRSVLFFSLSANKLVARVYNSASLWLTTLAAGTSTALATMSICNRDIRSLICLSPSVGTASINFCVTSYADEIRLAVVVDPNIVPDPKFLTDSFIQQVCIFSQMMKLTSIVYSVEHCPRTARSSPYPG
jgi:hypothetical protein